MLSCSVFEIDQFLDSLNFKVCMMSGYSTINIYIYGCIFHIYVENSTYIKVAVDVDGIGNMHRLAGVTLHIRVKVKKLAFHFPCA